MASTRSHSRSSYSILLLQKLLNLRDGVSPLTLVLDSPQQPGHILLEEFMLRAKSTGSKVIYVSSYITGPQRSPHVDVWIERKTQTLADLHRAIISQCQNVLPAQPRTGPPRQKIVIVIDSLCEIAQQSPLHVAAFISSLAISPSISLLGLYHTDDPDDGAAVGFLGSGQGTTAVTARLAAGKPPPIRVLCHLATAVLRVYALHQEVAKKRARDRSEEEPRFGATVGDGWLFGYRNMSHANKSELLGPLYENGGTGIVISMELRRRSGRAVVERYVLGWGTQRTAKPTAAASTTTATATDRTAAMPWELGAAPCQDISVMDDNALFAALSDFAVKIRGGGQNSASDGKDGRISSDDEENLPQSTFNLGLTDKQRRDREGIVLPYFDAQTDIGAGEGGRILYEMGREDDFDDEEDEI